MALKISKHAGQRMRERKISLRLIALAIEKGEKQVESSDGEVIRYRLPMSIDGLEVVAHLNVIIDCDVVVTVYVRGCL
jgi:hypothetical protein